MSEVKELFVGLIQHLKEHQDSFVVKKRVNEAVLVFFEVLNQPNKLLDEIDEFAQSFKEKG